MEQNDFQDKVINNLAELNTGQKDIIRRLDAGDVKFNALFNKTEHNRELIFEHERTCSAKDNISKIQSTLDKGEHPGSNKITERLATIEQCLKRQEGSKSTMRYIWDYIKPAVWIIIGILFTIVLLHFDEVRGKGIAAPNGDSKVQTSR